MWWGGGKQQGVLWKMCKLANSATRLPTLFLGLFPSSRHFLTEKLWGRVCLKTVVYGTFQSSQICQEDVESFLQMPR